MEGCALVDVSASIGLGQLKRLPEIVRLRRVLAERYFEILRDVPVGLPEEPPWARSNWQSFCVRLPAGCDQRELMQRNAAYFRTHQYMVVAVLAGVIVLQVWERATGLAISVGQMSNFLTLLFFSGLIMPATLLAWQDPLDD